ncbi:hypothetical protein [Paenibacillus sp. 1P07SE]|uniref:hypothetical protein n=1 Tax=Paenibacillus sp. 1P07SE TaxID=3132209 RepID=UPI0039A462D9
MRLEEWQLGTLLQELSEEDREQMKQAFEEHFHQKMDWSPEGLAVLKLEVLIPLRDAARGMVLTRKHASRMADAVREAQEPEAAAGESE